MRAPAASGSGLRERVQPLRRDRAEAGRPPWAIVVNRSGSPTGGRPIGRPRRRRVRSRGSRTDQHLADPPAVGRLDGQRQPVDLDLVARLRHAADAVVDEPADRVVLVLVLERRGRCRTAPSRSSTDGPPVDARLVVGELDDHRLLVVVLVLDLADDLLEQVLDRDQAGGAAVLVEHDRDVDLAPLELVEQVVDRHRLGHEDRRPQDRAQRRALRRPSRLRNGQQVLGVEDPDDLVDRVLVDRDRGCGPRSMTVSMASSSVAVRRQRDDGDARDHHLVDALVAELDDRVDHLLLLGLEDALLAAALDDQAQLLGA